MVRGSGGGSGEMQNKTKQHRGQWQTVGSIQKDSKSQRVREKES